MANPGGYNISIVVLFDPPAQRSQALVILRSGRLNKNTLVFSLRSVRQVNIEAYRPFRPTEMPGYVPKLVTTRAND
eukprot:6173273-Pleurochrysis_carterae.AAC.1